MSDDERAASADGGKRLPWILIGAVAVVVVLVGGGLGAWLVLRHTHQSRQVVLPFAGVREPYGVAVDAAGDVYVGDANNAAGVAADANTNRVLQLPAGSTTAFTLPFNGLKNPSGVAVDTAGNVYITDVSPGGKHSRVLKLPAG